MTRCFGTGDPLYERYHDEEWGRPPQDVPDEAPLFERIALEGFQAGLSWLTVLRKREAFRVAFCGFRPDVVAGYGDEEVARLSRDPTIIRNPLKIRATIHNARAVVSLHEQGLRLWDVLRGFAPEPWAAPGSMAELPSSTAESEALSRRMKQLGFTFVGPVTMYATLQALGLVNDHLADCPQRGPAGEASRAWDSASGSARWGPCPHRPEPEPLAPG